MNINECQEFCSLAVSHHLYFLRISIVRSMLHQGLVGPVQSKKSYLWLPILFLPFVVVFVVVIVVFYQEIYVFIIFICFFDEVPNFCNCILTNQKSGLILKDCQ